MAIISKTAAQWEAAKTTVLSYGDTGYETDTYKRKIGDGVTQYQNLTYEKLIRPRRAIKAQWEAKDPVIGKDEIVVESDTKRMKFGDGTTAYSSLPYADVYVTGLIGALASLSTSAKTTIVAAINELYNKFVGVVRKIKLNGQTYSPDSTGLVDLGTIEGGGGTGGSVSLDTTMPEVPTDTKAPSTKLMADEHAKLWNEVGKVSNIALNTNTYFNISRGVNTLATVINNNFRDLSNGFTWLNSIPYSNNRTTINNTVLDNSRINISTKGAGYNLVVTLDNKIIHNCQTKNELKSGIICWVFDKYAKQIRAYNDINGEIYYSEEFYNEEFYYALKDVGSFKTTIARIYYNDSFGTVIIPFPICGNMIELLFNKKTFYPKIGFDRSIKGTYYSQIGYPLSNCNFISDNGVEAVYEKNNESYVGFSHINGSIIRNRSVSMSIKFDRDLTLEAHFGINQINYIYDLETGESLGVSTQNVVSDKWYRITTFIGDGDRLVALFNAASIPIGTMITIKDAVVGYGVPIAFIPAYQNDGTYAYCSECGRVAELGPIVDNDYLSNYYGPFSSGKIALRAGIIQADGNNAYVSCTDGLTATQIWKKITP